MRAFSGPQIYFLSFLGSLGMSRPWPAGSWSPSPERSCWVISRRRSGETGGKGLNFRSDVEDWACVNLGGMISIGMGVRSTRTGVPSRPSPWSTTTHFSSGGKCQNGSPSKWFPESGLRIQIGFLGIKSIHFSTGRWKAVRGSSFSWEWRCIWIGKEFGLHSLCKI